MKETFRLDLNQSWEAIDIKTGQAVFIPKGSHQAIRMPLKGSRDPTEENYLVVTVQHEGNPAARSLLAPVGRPPYSGISRDDSGNGRETTSTTPKTSMTCVYQKTLSLVLLSTNPTRGASFLIALGGNFSIFCTGIQFFFCSMCVSSSFL